MLTECTPTSVAHQYNVIMVVSPSFKLAMLVSDGNNSELSPGAISFENTLEASKSPTFFTENFTAKVDPATASRTGSPTASCISTSPINVKSGAAGILSISNVLLTSSVLTPDSFTILKLILVEPSTTDVESQLKLQS